MLYSLIKFKVMTDGSIVLTPWKQSLEALIGELQDLKEHRHNIGIQYIEPRKLDVRILFYNSNYRETFIRTNVIKSAGLSALWLPDPDVVKVDKPFEYTFEPKTKTDDVKVLMNSLYGVKSVKKLGDATSIHISTEGYEPTIRWNREGYTSIFEDSTFHMYDTPLCTFEYKEDKNLNSVIRHVQVNEKKKIVTIVWKDGEVTMAKCGPNDTWDPEKGVLVCVAKRFFNSNTQFSKWLKSVIPEPEDEMKSIIDRVVENMAKAEQLSKYQPKHAK